ncbi:MAG: flagellar hook-length control protein FliK [Lachnospiraceae bacterium]|nr:flagellar hook-length control protein FliK [Lachnospiraceae bacterium]
MAGVNGVSLGAVSIQELAVKRGGSSVSAGSTKSFEQFLNNGTSAQKQEAVSIKDSQASANTLDQPSASAKRDNLQAEDVKETDGMVQSVTEDGMPEDGKAEELLQEIRNIVKETLSVDDETVDGALEMMGISIMDLLDTATLQQFVLIVNGGQESTDFLTNEGLLQEFMDLSAALEDFSVENAGSLAAMMEQLETPVAFDEFLQQQGLTEEEAGKLLQEQPGTEATVHLQEAAAGETEGSKGQALPEMVEKVTISHSSGQQTEPVMAKENLSQDSSMENGFSEDASTLFSSERGAEEPQSQIVAPLFADQLNGLQDDMANIWKPEMNGAQRMQQMVDIVNQVSSQLRSSLSENVTKMEMQLNPESLGKVLFSVVSKAGVMTATFQVQSEEAKQALESQMLTLRETLEAKNLKVESVDVQISDFNFTQSNEAEAQNQRQNEAARQGRKRFRFDTEETDKMEGVEENNAETVRRQVMRDTGGSIDFTA